MVSWETFLEVVMAMTKDKRKYNKDRMSMKISFTHYMKWARVMLPVVLEEFELVCDSFAIFFFLLLLSISKRSNLRLLLVVNKIKCKCGRNNSKLKSSVVLFGIILLWVELCVDVI